MTLGISTTVIGLVFIAFYLFDRDKVSRSNSINRFPSDVPPVSKFTSKTLFDYRTIAETLGSANPIRHTVGLNT